MGKVHVVYWEDFLGNIALENVVKHQGRLIIATINSDYDKEGRFIGDHSELFAIAEPYKRKYNPDNLSQEKYREAYSKCELPWQQNDRRNN